MKVLVYSASSICNPQFGIQMEMAIDYFNKGHDVVFCFCNGSMKACSANPLGNTAFCNICKLGYKSGTKSLPKGIKVVGFNNQSKEKHAERFFNTLSDIKRYQYKGVDVGFSVISVYISKTRNPNPVFNHSFNKCLNFLIDQATALVDEANNIIEQEKPDLIVFFNGRYFDTKPFYCLAINKQIQYQSTEDVGGVRAGKEYRIVRFNNSIPHDARKMYENCLASWDRSLKSISEKEALGKIFFEKRRNGQKAGDYVYTRNQIDGKLPKSYNPQKKNVVFYCSSEDEYSSISLEIDKYHLFNSQYEGIKYIVENINDDNYYFYVRIHPNMKGLDFDYHRNLYKLSTINNVTVIAPEDTISSYALMDIAYNIVVFGSTIGAESLFWGKPVVLLGYAAYYYWGCLSVPTDKMQAVEMVKKPIVYPGAREMAIKYGFFYLENSLAENSNYISISPIQLSVFGRKIFVFDYLKIFRSSLLFRAIYIVYTKLLTLFHKNKISYPDRLFK